MAGGVSFFGGVGEILKGVGKVGGFLGKPVAKTAGYGALGALDYTGRFGMGVAEKLGSGLIGQSMKHPGLVLGAAATVGAVGGILADQDGQADPGKTALKGAAFGLGAAALGGAGALTGLGVGALGAGVMGVGALGTVGRGLVKAPKGPVGLGNLGDFELNKKFAVPLILGASAVKGIGDGVKAFEKSRMGMNDGMMRSATPMMPNPLQAAPSNPSFANNAGATGDLVFAMHRNR